ncbi:hypothetical protein GCM10010259_62430 [Streptomyces daghestanicus]|uniref:Uncharacterized protein n=1 Tax=Streptomyces daghestanicus TaxID=66885 RepID=A0ABQ3PVK7_9ACTN|nr:hypothetical protein GCM10010259_62430 [Streptomyces daghestanicus]GHI29046.1 hypothetical protein Sdagh_07760 [Streptomyces daghestanicus]
MARLLDEDPFVLPLLRGRGGRAVRDSLRARAAPAAGDDAEGVDAAAAYAASDTVPPLPELPGVPGEPGVAPSLDTDTAPGPGVDPAALAFLASRAASEAGACSPTPWPPDAGSGAWNAGCPLRGMPYAWRRETLRNRWETVRDLPGSDVSRQEGARNRQGQVAQGGRRARHRDGPPGGRRGAGSARVSDGRPRVAARRGRRTGRTGGGAGGVRPGARTRAYRPGAGWDEDERPSPRARANRWTADGEPLRLRLDADGRRWPYREEVGRWIPAGGSHGTRPPRWRRPRGQPGPTTGRVRDGIAVRVLCRRRAPASSSP